MSASAVLKLQHAGFTAEQVEALAEFLDDRAATKDDAAEIKRMILESKIEVIKWSIGGWFAVAGLIIAVLKFLG